MIVDHSGKTTALFTYQVISFEALSGDVHRVLLQTDEENRLRYLAGQYLEIIDDDNSGKPFSIANAPHAESVIELHIRYLPDNPYTLKLLNEIKIKKQLRISGPYGKSFYRPSHGCPLILIAGGTGFAPIKAIIEQTIQEKLIQPIYLYWGVRTFQDLYLHHLPLMWQKQYPDFHYVPVLSNANWQGRMGLVHEAVLRDHRDFSHYHIYAFGPPEMVSAAFESFRKLGLNSESMYSDCDLKP